MKLLKKEMKVFFGMRQARQTSNLSTFHVREYNFTCLYIYNNDPLLKCNWYIFQKKKANKIKTICKTFKFALAKTFCKH